MSWKKRASNIRKKKVSGKFKIGRIISKGHDSYNNIPLFQNTICFSEGFDKANDVTSCRCRIQYNGPHCSVPLR